MTLGLLRGFASLRRWQGNYNVTCIYINTCNRYNAYTYHIDMSFGLLQVSILFPLSRSLLRGYSLLTVISTHLHKVGIMLYIIAYSMLNILLQVIVIITYVFL